MISENSISKNSSIFATTQWTRVLEARGNSPEAKAALSDLCAAYYSPVFAFIRHNARDEDAARDLTQEFFARLLARHGLNTVEQSKGRFRSFLLGAVKHFLADMRDRANAAKRGSGQSHESIEPGTDTSAGLQLADENALNPEAEFDKKWALTILDRALAALADEHKTADKFNHFEILKPWLTGDTESLSQAKVARQLNMNEGAVKVAIHRLRRRFRELVKREIGQTLHDPSQVEEELACLVAALNS
ncbi:MAG: sigma-70 family RNA polymerase sigma factor [Verrucomicrobiota bacterium]|nr:sigma-70 family RNA polymerase sigma factor [Verrucomicrobiota bacterium]